MFAKEVRGPGRMTLRVVGELLDLDPDVAGVAFEGLAIVVGTFGEVTGKTAVRRRWDQC